MKEEAMELYAQYAKNKIDRRQFLERLAVLAGGMAAAYALLPGLETPVARAALTSADDNRLTVGSAQIPVTGGTMKGYEARPKEAGKVPAVLVVHENRGLNAHIEDVTRRLALAGFLALAPDALSLQGGTPPDQEQAIAMIKTLDMVQTIQNFTAAAAYLKTHPQSTGKVGVVGFCWGGAIANNLAVHSPDIRAAVPYYGMQPASAEVVKIRASLLLHYAELDERINQGIPALKEALAQHGIDHELYMYPGTQHAFNNDTNPARYNKEAADLAWQRTIDFLTRKLQS